MTLFKRENAFLRLAGGVRPIRSISLNPILDCLELVLAASDHDHRACRFDAYQPDSWPPRSSLTAKDSPVSRGLADQQLLAHLQTL